MNDRAEVDENQEESVEDIKIAEKVNPEPEESEAEADEVIVSIGEDAPPAEEEVRAPEWVRELRKTNREKERRIRELEAKLSATTTEIKPVVTLGPRPKLDAYDYDTDLYEQALDQWHERKREHDREAEQAQQSEQQQQQAWQAKLNDYGKARAELKVRDYEDAEETVQQLLNITQQGVLLNGCDNPALVVYALGKNPKKTAELAAMTDPVKFAVAVAKLEKELKVTNRRATPPPERVVSGTGRSSGAVDSTLERLREEASRTGNMTKVIQYKAQKRSASK
jgi:hypothetical protein